MIVIIGIVNDGKIIEEVGIYESIDDSFSFPSEIEEEFEEAKKNTIQVVSSVFVDETIATVTSGLSIEDDPRLFVEIFLENQMATKKELYGVSRVIEPIPETVII